MTASVNANTVSIHAPSEGSDMPQAEYGRLAIVSIHAPSEGSDAARVVAFFEWFVSIHAPSEGSDHNDQTKKRQTQSFNPRSQ